MPGLSEPVDMRLDAQGPGPRHTADHAAAGQCQAQDAGASTANTTTTAFPHQLTRVSLDLSLGQILSGKGGVGKSTFTTLLAHALAATPSRTVGVLDVDICGPSIPTMLGVVRETLHVTSSGWSPVWVSDNLCAASIQFMLPGRDAAVIWRGAKKNGLIKRFLRELDWQDVDTLLVDTPPGTSDEHLSVHALLRDAGLDGAVLLTGPQEVSLLDVRKQIDFCRKAGIRVLGLVENMSAFVCPKCTHVSDIFRATTGGGRGLAEEMGVPFLGAIPLDPRIGIACDYGESFVDSFPESPACKALEEVVERLSAML